MSLPRLLVLLFFVLATVATAQEKNNTPPPGFKALFNGKDLTGWTGLPLKREEQGKSAVCRDDDARTVESITGGNG
jgi:hypothetical protein